MKKERSIACIFLILGMVLLLVACAPAAAPAPAPAPAAPAPAPAAAKAVPATPPAKPAWEGKWEETLAAAKNEGRIMLTASNSLRGLTEGFQKAHGIGVEVVVAPGGRAVTQIVAERRAGLYFRDVYIGGSGTQVITMKPAGLLGPLDSAFILPDLTDPELIKKIWWPGKLWWVDADHTVLAPLLFPGPPIAINTNLVKREEIGSWYDLLNPKWKGKIATLDPSIGGGTNIATLTNYALGWDWLQQMVKNEPVLTQDERLLLEWLARGKVAIVLDPSPPEFVAFKEAGAPVQSVTPKEGTWMGSSSGSFSMLNRAAHPNASKIFINWLLSREGQTILARSIGGQSAREDVPTDFLDPQQVRVAGMAYLNKEREDWLLVRGEVTTKAKQILVPSTMK